MVAVVTKICTHRFAVGGWHELMTVPAPYLLVALAVAVTMVQNSAFHAGSLQASVPIMLVGEPVVAVVLGVVVLGEHLAVRGSGVLGRWWPSSPWWLRLSRWARDQASDRDSASKHLDDNAITKCGCSSAVAPPCGSVRHTTTGRHDGASARSGFEEIGSSGNAFGGFGHLTGDLVGPSRTFRSEDGAQVRNQ